MDKVGENARGAAVLVGDLKSSVWPSALQLMGVLCWDRVALPVRPGRDACRLLDAVADGCDAGCGWPRAELCASPLTAGVSGSGRCFRCSWAALVFARASRYAVVLPGVQREGQAVPPGRAAAADRLGLGDLIQGGARRGDREEQFRVSRPACGQLPPVRAGGSDPLVARGPGRGRHLRA
jgi:hypothetical protein